MKQEKEINNTNGLKLCGGGEYRIISQWIRVVQEGLSAWPAAHSVIKAPDDSGFDIVLSKWT
jgi:hypothetical protein